MNERAIRSSPTVKRRHTHTERHETRKEMGKESEIETDEDGRSVHSIRFLSWYTLCLLLAV
jgi:hypothetical protein